MAEKKEIAEKNKNRLNAKSKIVDNNKVNVSNEWSWDNEKESDISNWLGMPKEEFKNSFSFEQSNDVSEAEIFEVDNKGKRNGLPDISMSKRQNTKKGWNDSITDSQKSEKHRKTNSRLGKRSVTKQKSDKSQLLVNDSDQSASALDISIEDYNDYKGKDYESDVTEDNYNQPQKPTAKQTQSKVYSNEPTSPNPYELKKRDENVFDDF